MTEETLRTFLIKITTMEPSIMIVVLAMVDKLPGDLAPEMCADALHFVRVRLQVVTDHDLKKDLQHAEKVLMARGTNEKGARWK